MVAIAADLKTKDLALGMGHCTAFMRFRGPQALKDNIKGRPFFGVGS